MFLFIKFRSIYDDCHVRIIEQQQHNQGIKQVYQQEILNEHNYDDIHLREAVCLSTFFTGQDR